MSFFCYGKNANYETLFCNYTEIKNINEEKIIGIIIDNKRKFKSHMKYM